MLLCNTEYLINLLLLYVLCILDFNYKPKTYYEYTCQ